jgi:hypothetical protein
LPSGTAAARRGDPAGQETGWISCSSTELTSERQLASDLQLTFELEHGSAPDGVSI